jgi:hypothetical protein
MKIKCYNTEFEIPDLLISKFTKDYNMLPGSAHRENVYELRDAINNVLSFIDQEPDLLNEREYLDDFIKATAMQQALAKNGILFDA